ncbi:MAG TPA: 50S ribosomal protein L11 methyltransferase [Chloroflexi bacterium]|nr:50S ribosomal protein L11 methyltransferase [Chloroflexota bacterium]
MVEVNRWLEVSVTVDGELAEAVAEVLARYVPGGVVIESTQVDVSTEDEGRVVGPLRVCGYLPTDENLEATRRKIAEGLWYLSRIRPMPEPQFRPVGEQNWAETWKQHYRPIEIGERLLILPAWMEPPAGRRLPILLEPGMGFGTGTHPTTQLSLLFLEETLPPGEPVIDVGCGSGILSIAAVKLGASRALGVDVDADAVASARENAARNGVTEQTAFEVGSVPEVRRGVFGLRQAPLVVANIIAPVLVRLLDEGLPALLSPGGTLLLSGILRPQMGGEDGHVSILDALERNALRITAQKQQGDWVALAVGRA